VLVSWAAKGFAPPWEATLHWAAVGRDSLPLAETATPWKLSRCGRCNHKRLVFNKMLMPESTDRLSLKSDRVVSPYDECKAC